MGQPLEGCNAKLERARHHFESLREAIQQDFDQGPDLIPSELDPVAGRYVFRVLQDVSLPSELEWSVIIGDVVHNLFAALDYLAWELVAVSGGQGTTSTAFPIFTDAARYRTDAPRKMKGMSADAQRIVWQLQPFQHPARHHPDDHPLARLYQLELRDKHRTLNLVTVSAAGTLRGLPPHIHLPPGASRFITGPYKKGAVIGTLTGLSGTTSTQLYLEVTRSVAFDLNGPCGGRDVLMTLDEVRRYVRDSVVAQFTRFFPV